MDLKTKISENKEKTDSTLAIKNIKRSKRAYTHSGIFHADDLFGAALIKLINPNIKIIRTSEPERYDGELMFDIGNGRYDHHQELKLRDNGVPYAAFGLLMRDLYPFFMDKESYRLFDDAFIKEIDLCDNTQNKNPLSTALMLFNPAWNSTETEDDAFDRTVAFITPYLKRMIDNFTKSDKVPHFWKPWHDVTSALVEASPERNILDKFLKSESAVYGKYRTNPLHILLCSGNYRQGETFLKLILRYKENRIRSSPAAYLECMSSYKGGNTLILNRYVPYEEFAEEFPIEFVVFPSARKGFNICAVQKNTGTGRKYKKLFPERLRGKDESFLRSEYKGLIFVHPSGFMAATETCEEATEFIKSINEF